MPTVLAAARSVMAKAGEAFYVQANIDTGPFSLAAVLRGTETFLLDLATADEKDLGDLLEFCTEVVVAYGRAMIATGVHGIQFGDATASLISPHDFARFVLPWQRRALEALGGKRLRPVGAHLRIHGAHPSTDAGPPLPGFRSGFTRSTCVRRAGAWEKGSRLKGNLDTTFLLQRDTERGTGRMPTHPRRRRFPHRRGPLPRLRRAADDTA